MIKNEDFSYSISKQELLELALFFRKKNVELPDGLITFSSAIEKFVYESMTIDEAEQFYNENTKII
jgi:hypothetical protein